MERVDEGQEVRRPDTVWEYFDWFTGWLIDWVTSYSNPSSIFRRLKICQSAICSACSTRRAMWWDGANQHNRSDRQSNKTLLVSFNFHELKNDKYNFFRRERVRSRARRSRKRATLWKHNSTGPVVQREMSVPSMAATIAVPFHLFILHRKQNLKCYIKVAENRVLTMKRKKRRGIKVERKWERGLQSISSTVMFMRTLASWIRPTWHWSFSCWATSCWCWNWFPDHITRFGYEYIYVGFQ